MHAWEICCIKIYLFSIFVNIDERIVEAIDVGGDIAVFVGEVVGAVEADCGGIVGTGFEVVEVEAGGTVELLVAELPALGITGQAAGNLHRQSERIVVVDAGECRVARADVHAVVAEVIAQEEVVLRSGEAVA